MSKYTLNGILEHLRQELTLTEAEAKEIGSHFEVLRRETESMKIDVIQNYLEEQRKSAARDRGIASLIKDRKRVRDSLLVAAGSFILGGLLTRDKFGAVTAGMSGFDGLVQGLGQTRWYVLLDNKIIVAPEDGVNPAADWVTWENLTAALVKLKRKALAGEKLGDLDNIISKLRRGKLVHLWILTTNQGPSNKENSG